MLNVNNKKKHARMREHQITPNFKQNIFWSILNKVYIQRQM